MAADLVFREMVRVSSKSLSGLLDRFEAGERFNRKRLKSMAISLARYAMRSSGRPTPFGLAAGVTRADWGERAEVRFGRDDRRSARIDASWLYAEIAKWFDRPETRQGLHVVVNNLCHVQGNRLVLPYVRIRSERHGPQATSLREVNVANNRFVQWLLANCRRPMPYGDVVACAVRELPGATEELVDRLLLQLIKNEVLVTSVTPHRMGREALARITEATGGATEENRVQRVGSRLRDYEACAVGRGGEIWDEIQRDLSEGYDGSRPSVQVDLRLDADIVLPRSIAEEVAAYASVMWRISGRVSGYDHLREYKHQFLDRYGSQVTVPLPDVVSATNGIGFPAGYQNPTVLDRPPHFPSEEDSEGAEYLDRRREVMATLMQRAMMSPGREVVLGEDEIAALTYRVDAEPPRAMELFFQVLSESVADLDGGDFRLCPTPNMGSMTVGSTIARFSELLGCTDELIANMREYSDAGRIEAEVSFLPLNPRAVNILPTARIGEYEIPLGSFADPGASGTIDWRDLSLAVERNEFKLYWTKTGQEVVPRAPNMLALDQNAPNLGRLLAEIGFVQDKMLHPWQWTGLESMPFFPRVRYGKVIVSPATWRPTPDVRAAVADQRKWARAVETWRADMSLPRHVVVMVGDKSYSLDLDDSFHIEMLRKEAMRSNVIVTEQLHEQGRYFGWCGGRSNEIVVPLQRASPARLSDKPALVVAPPVAFPQAPENHTYLPGEAWLFAKIYVPSGRFNTLLAQWLPHVLSDVQGDIDRWFYIRYRDPASHIRLRMHGEPGAIAERVLPALARHARVWREAGLVQRMVLDTYEPEYARYGSGALMTLAEEVFCVDSTSCLAQLGMRDKLPPGLPDEILVAANYAMILESLGDWNWWSWASHVFRGMETSEIYRKHRKRIAEIIRPGRATEGFAAATGARHVADAWRSAPEIQKYGSALLLGDGLGTVSRDQALMGLLHMHHNRLFGIDRQKEKAGYAVLASLAKDHVYRTSEEGSSVREDRC
ncbi:lantibiotic dehydratase [Streptomyces sp. NPDC015232]|uniref:lantibiotic dehydratase n=1 Tax=unclassified Streptomyces TaxID=2593676 RepID=UPI0036FA0644